MDRMTLAVLLFVAGFGCIIVGLTWAASILSDQRRTPDPETDVALMADHYGPDPLDQGDRLDVQSWDASMGRPHSVVHNDGLRMVAHAQDDLARLVSLDRPGCVMYDLDEERENHEAVETYNLEAEQRRLLGDIHDRNAASHMVRASRYEGFEARTPRGMEWGEDGQTTSEYVVALSVLMLVGLLAFMALGDGLASAISNVSAQL